MPDTEKTHQESNLEKTDPDKAQKKKSKKVPYLVLAAVLLLGGGSWAYYDHHQKVEAEVAAEAKRQQQMEELHEKLAAFYTDDHHQFIRADMIHQDLSKLKNDLSSLKNEKGYSELETTYQDIQSKIRDIQKVNEWFIAPAIVDDHLADDIKLKADKEIQAIETDNTDFGKLIQQAQTEAKNQYAELQTAKEKTAIVFKDGKVVDSATRDQYKTAKEAVEKVKNTDLSAQLNEQLKQVDKMLTDKEKKKKKRKRKKQKKRKKQLKNKQNKPLKQQLQLKPLNKLRSHKQHSKKRHPRPLPLQTQRISQSNLPEQVILPMHLIQHGRGHQVSKAK